MRSVSVKPSLSYSICRVQNPRLVRPPSPRLHLPKLKHISAETLPCHFHLIATPLDPWTSQWETAVALESDDPRCCILSPSAKNYLASRSCPVPRRLCYLLVSDARCIMQSMVLSRESISSVYAVVIPVRPLFATYSSSVQLAGIRSDLLTLSSVRLCAARAARAVFDLIAPRCL